MLDLLLPRTQPAPKFEINTDDPHAPSARIDLCGLSAITAIIRDELSALTIWGVMLYGLYCCFVYSPVDFWVWCVAVIAPWIFYPLLYVCMGWILTRRKRIIIDASNLSFSSHFIQKTISRETPLSFALMPHIRAKWEAGWHAHYHHKDRQKRRARHRKPYFQASFHVVAVSHHEVHKLITIYDEQQAQKCLAALNAAKERVDGQLGIGKGVASAPEHEWRAQAGELPQ